MPSSTPATLRDKVASTAVAPANGNAPTVYDLINSQRAEIERALPKHLDADRLLRIAITQVRQTPKLAECSRTSLLAGIMLSAQLGLEPGPLGHCYLIPRRIKGVWEVQWMLGYRGIIELARRSGQLVSIEAHEVCEHDQFEFSYGLDPILSHTYDLRNPRGNPFAYYGVAHFKEGGHYFLVMSVEEIERRRARSSSAGAEFSPWKSDFPAMARKTVIRAMAPYLPVSAEILNGISSDDTVRRSYTPPDSPEFIEGVVIDDDETAGEIESGSTGGPTGEEPFETNSTETTGQADGRPKQ
jgi:recombination protein RecT